MARPDREKKSSEQALGPATIKALERAEEIAKRQKFTRPVQDPDSLLESQAIVATGEIEGSMIETVDKDGVVKKARTKATIVYDGSSGVSRVIAGTPDKLGLPQVKRITQGGFFRSARAALAVDARERKRRAKVELQKKKP